MRDKVYIFDSTLRDGSQAKGVSFSVLDKIKIVKKLDDLGIDYIEAGNPSSNPKDREFFKEATKLSLRNSKLCAFGSTRKPNIKVEEDKNLNEIINSKVNVICIFGKSWDFHVTDIIKTSLEENIEMIRESITYLVSLGKEVIFDAEHFFDGYKNNPSYALEVISTAKESGARWIVLCDTNGGTMPNEIQEITRFLIQDLKFNNLGVHFHNDSGVAVANSIVAVNEGVRHIQGTFNGLGERCGNANLSTIIPNLNIKMDFKTIPDNNLKFLSSTYRYICEVSNIVPNEREAYVGNYAFAHKGGMHIDAINKNTRSFEHIHPNLIGNKRDILMSEVSGRSTIVKSLNKVNSNINKDSYETRVIMEKLKKLEHEGYEFEGADGSFELLVRKELNVFKPSFELIEYKMVKDAPSASNYSATAVVKIMVNGVREIAAADGNGPVNALDKALRRSLSVFYDDIKNMYLTDYKVRVISEDKATSAKVRVMIESTDGQNTWTTVGVSHDIIEASWKALVDSVEYKLLCLNKGE
ncbi:MAG: citramalate synthase [Clostridium perfringens]|nr:citramalate synthase [Clostridium perfringens]